MQDYGEKLAREKEWHLHNTCQKNHILNSPLFFSSKRNRFNYRFPKMRMAGLLQWPEGVGRTVPASLDAALSEWFTWRGM